MLIIIGANGNTIYFHNCFFYMGSNRSLRILYYILTRYNAPNASNDTIASNKFATPKTINGEDDKCE